MSSISQVESALRVACEKARAGGVTLVRDGFQVVVPCTWDRRESVVAGACALGAYDIFDGKGLNIEPRQWDAIELGWDGDIASAKSERLPMSWFALGRRLAAEFSPVPASSVGEA